TTARPVVIHDNKIVDKPIFDYVNDAFPGRRIIYRYTGNYLPVIKNVISFSSYKDKLRWGNFESLWVNSQSSWVDMEMQVDVAEKHGGAWEENPALFNDTALNNE